jgi:hypothetical protein
MFLLAIFLLHDIWFIVVDVVVAVAVAVAIVELYLKTLYFRLYTVQLFSDFWTIN